MGAEKQQGVPAPAPCAAADECVRVVVRCRPLNAKEQADGRTRIVAMDIARGQVTLAGSRGGGGAASSSSSAAAAGAGAAASEPPKAFTFDAVFDCNSKQADVYENTAAGIVTASLEGYNGTVFAYGQTGTGKTHTMEGSVADPGIIPKAFDHIFRCIEASTAAAQYLVRASFLEVYNEEIRDLLSKAPKERLELREHKDGGVYVKGLNAFVVKGVPDIRSVLEVGKKNRSVGATLMNQDSSRSHSVFTVTIETVQHGPASDGHIRVGKLNLVDLAGSERQGKTGATGDRLKEATKINLSLSALGNVISALVDGRGGHIPYRDSKLTRLLQDSLGGNTKTVMVANIGPADWNYEETLSTLRYANRAKSITNKPHVNEDPKDAMLREFQDEITRLRAALEAAEAGGGVPGGPGATQQQQQAVEQVVQVPKRLAAGELEQMKLEIAAELQAQLAAESGGGQLTDAQRAQVAAEVEVKVAAEGARLEAAARAAEAEAARYEAKQRQLQQRLAAAAEEHQTVAQQKQELAARLAALQGKILQGAARGGLVELTREKEQQLARREEELQRRMCEEAAAAAAISRIEDEALAANSKFSSLAEEAADKGRKLARLWRRYQEVDAEVSDAYAEWQAEKEDLLDAIRQLGQQLALKDTIINGFIPQEEVNKVLARAHWEAETETWTLARLPPTDPTRPMPLDPLLPQPLSTAELQQRFNCGIMPASGRPFTTPGARRPMCSLTKAALLAGDMNPRFRSDNILALELDLPERLTYDLGPDGPDPRAQAAIDAAFWDDGYVLLMGPASPGGSLQQALHLVPDRRPAADLERSARCEMRAEQQPYQQQQQHQQRPSSASRRRPGSAASIAR